MKILVFGGSASGKSEFAENLILDLNKISRKNLIYLATLDSNSGGDTKSRIEKHKKMRFGKNFETVELKIQNSELKFDNIFDFPSILLEDLGNLVSRVVFDSKICEICKENYDFSKIILDFIENLSCENLVIVANDIFLENVDLSDFGMRKYFEVISSVTNSLCKKSDKVFRVVAGVPILLEVNNEF